MTGVYYFWEENPAGGEPFFGQGQLLPMIDLRSLYILGYALLVLSQL